MIIIILRYIITFLLFVILVINMTQRKHLAHGEAKRLATLKLAGIIFLAYAGFLVMENQHLPDPVALPIIIIPIILGYFFRADLFLFKTHCLSCAAPLSMKRILYYDSNLCSTCDPDTSDTPHASAIPDNSVANDTPPADPNKDIPQPGLLPSEPVPRSVADIAWDAHRFDQEAVLCFIITGEELLLIHKKTGLGKGKINAPGGRLEPGETAAEAAVRETQEETGVTPTNLTERVELSFLFTNGFSLHAKVFFADGMSGTPYSTREAEPFLCPLSDIPYAKMWADDQEWLPPALEGKYVRGWFIFEGDSMVDKLLEISD